MSNSTLVAYATQYGSTAEVALSIATALTEAGLNAEARPIGDIDFVNNYGAIVIGAPLYIGRWHSDARKFLERHRDSLISRRVAIFALGPLTDASNHMAEGRDQFAHELLRYPWLRPISVRVFAGKYDPSDLNLPHRALAAVPASPLNGLPANDARDWSDIAAWSQTLVNMFQPA